MKIPTALPLTSPGDLGPGRLSDDGPFSAFWVTWEAFQEEVSVGRGFYGSGILFQAPEASYASESPSLQHQDQAGCPAHQGSPGRAPAREPPPPAWQLEQELVRRC